MQQKIIAEEKVTDGKVKEIIIEWDKNKPVQGDVVPDRAINDLAIFEGRVSRLSDDYEQICKAKEALDLDFKSDSRLVPVMEELRDLKSVWVSLATVTSSIASVKESLWSNLVVKKLKSDLDEL